MSCLMWSHVSLPRAHTTCTRHSHRRTALLRDSRHAGCVTTVLIDWRSYCMAMPCMGASKAYCTHRNGYGFDGHGESGDRTVRLTAYGALECDCILFELCYWDNYGCRSRGHTDAPPAPNEVSTPIRPLRSVAFCAFFRFAYDCCFTQKGDQTSPHSSAE